RPERPLADQQGPTGVRLRADQARAPSQGKGTAMTDRGRRTIRTLTCASLLTLVLAAPAGASTIHVLSATAPAPNPVGAGVDLSSPTGTFYTDTQGDGGMLHRFDGSGAPEEFPGKGTSVISVPESAGDVYQLAVDNSGTASQGDIYVAVAGDSAGNGD